MVKVVKKRRSLSENTHSSGLQRSQVTEFMASDIADNNLPAALKVIQTGI